MEIADIINTSQTDQGVAWTSLSAITNNDNHYAYATINGSSKENAKPKSIEIKSVFDANSYSYDTDELFIEYKLYVDDGLQSLDGFSLLKQPTIIINFHDGKSYTIYQEEYCNDNYRDDYLINHVKVDKKLSLDLLNNEFTISFVFDRIDSVVDNDVTVYCDYVKVKLVSSLPMDTTNNCHWLPFRLTSSKISTNSNFYKKEQGAYLESGYVDAPVNESFQVTYESVNLRDDEYVIIQLGDGIAFDTSVGVTSQNCSVDYNSNTNII